MNDFVIIPVFVLNEILNFDLTQTNLSEKMCAQNENILLEIPTLSIENSPEIKQIMYYKS